MQLNFSSHTSLSSVKQTMSHYHDVPVRSKEFNWLLHVFKWCNCNQFEGSLNENYPERNLRQNTKITITKTHHVIFQWKRTKFYLLNAYFNYCLLQSNLIIFLFITYININNNSLNTIFIWKKLQIFSKKFKIFI